MRKLSGYVFYRAIFKKINSFMTSSETPMFKLIELETINRCNNTCSFCPANKLVDTRDFALMSEELFLKIIAELNELNYDGSLALYSSNEPFLDKRIIKFLKIAHENLPNAKLHLATNGTLLTLDKFKEAMKYLDILSINNYNDENELIPPVKEISQYIKKHSEYENRVVIVKRLKTQKMHTRGGNAKNRKIQKPLISSCYNPFTQVVISSKGTLSLCCNDIYGSETMGDLNNEKLIDIWQGEKYQLIREKLYQKKHGRENIEICSKCDSLGNM
jgi:radical SAM protein with 4Fe4S-binding SPASM domain